MPTYQVVVKIDGREPFATVVEAPRSGLAQTRALMNYFRSARSTAEGSLVGQRVDYDVEEVPGA